MNSPSTPRDNEKSSFVFKGSAAVGKNFWWSAYVTWPLAVLIIEEAGVTFTLPWKKYIFEWAHITQIKKHLSPSLLGIKITHNKADLPPYMVFQPKSSEREKLEDALAHYGFEFKIRS